MKNKLRSTILGLSALALPLNAEAGSVRFTRDLNAPKEADYAEACQFYNLSKDISGFTWVDFYRDASFYGETNVSKPINTKFSATAQAAHGSNLLGRVGLGAKFAVPKMPKGTFLELTALPVFFDGNGIRENESEIGYFASVNLPKGFSISSYADFNVPDNQWGFGEIDLGRDWRKLRVSYNPSLENDGNGTPKLNHRISVLANL